MCESGCKCESPLLILLSEFPPCPRILFGLSTWDPEQVCISRDVLFEQLDTPGDDRVSLTTDYRSCAADILGCPWKSTAILCIPRTWSQNSKFRCTVPCAAHSASLVRIGDSVLNLMRAQSEESSVYPRCLPELTLTAEVATVIDQRLNGRQAARRDELWLR